MADEPDEQTDRSADDAPLPCYLHPKREALLRCSRCEEPICAYDMIEAPVGYQCPRCAEGGAPVRRLTDLMPEAHLTRVLVAIIAVVFVATRLDDGGLVNRFALRPILVEGEPWVLVTSGFLHVNLMHVAFNGYLLWRLGQMLEPALGRARFGALYATGLAGGSLGVVGQAWLWAAIGTDVPILTTNPGIATLGASGAVFGLMGAAMVGLKERGINPWKTDIGALVGLNLVITFLIPMVSVGGHLGGLAAGVLAGKLLFVDRERAPRAAVVTWLTAIALFGAAYGLAAWIFRMVIG